MCLRKEGREPLWTRVSWVIVHALKLLVGVGWLAAQMLHRHQLWSVSASSWFLVPSFLLTFPFFSSLLRLGWSLAIPGSDPPPRSSPGDPPAPRPPPVALNSGDLCPPG